jgi:hypothetical protein
MSSHLEMQDGGRLPIVGVGASAGGLDAFMELVRHLPPKTGMGFVLLQHLDPEHESALTKILGKVATIPVCEAADNVRVKADHIYVIPPNRAMSIAGGFLRLYPRSELSSRNVLIYLGAQLQQKALPIFHYALTPGGFLLLGASESIGSSTDLFETVHEKHRIFTKRAVPTPTFRMHFAPTHLDAKAENLPGKFAEGARHSDFDMSPAVPTLADLLAASAAISILPTLNSFSTKRSKP